MTWLVRTVMERGRVDYWRRYGITQSEHFFQYLNTGLSISITISLNMSSWFRKSFREIFQLDMQLQKYGEGVQHACSRRQSQINVSRIVFTNTQACDSFTASASHRALHLVPTILTFSVENFTKRRHHKLRKGPTSCQHTVLGRIYIWFHYIGKLLYLLSPFKKYFSNYVVNKI